MGNEFIARLLLKTQKHDVSDRLVKKTERVFDEGTGNCNANV